MLLLVSLCRTQFYFKLTTLFEEFLLSVALHASFENACILNCYISWFIFTENCSAFLSASFSDCYVYSLMFLMFLAESLLHFYCLKCIKFSLIYLIIMKIWDCDIVLIQINLLLLCQYTLAYWFDIYLIA